MKYFDFKDCVDPHELTEVSPWILVLIADASMWCQKNDCVLIITRMIDDPFPGVSVSDTHHGRALDQSLKGWSEEKITAFKQYMTAKWGVMGAISRDTGTRTIVKDHDVGLGRHLHWQVRPDFSDFCIKS